MVTSDAYLIPAHRQRQHISRFLCWPYCTVHLEKNKKGAPQRAAPSGIMVIHHHDCACIRAFKACLCNYISGSISPSRVQSYDCFIKAKTSLFLTTQSVIAASRQSGAEPLRRSQACPLPQVLQERKQAEQAKPGHTSHLGPIRGQGSEDGG